MLDIEHLETLTKIEGIRVLEVDVRHKLLKLGQKRPNCSAIGF